MTERFDAIVVGAGHNGLVCATMLARAGKSVAVLEANEVVGGGAGSHEFSPGFRVSSCAHLLYQLPGDLRRKLGLDVPVVADDLATIALSDSGAHLRISGASVLGASAADRDAYQHLHRQLDRFSALLAQQFKKAPPRIGSGRRRDALALARLAFDLRRLGRTDMSEFLRLISMNVHDELVERFESPLLRGALALEAVLGQRAGPRSPGTLAALLHRRAGGGVYQQPTGGMGAVSDRLAGLAQEAGADIRLGTPVATVAVDNGRVVGVETASGDRLESYTVVSSASPQRTVLDLVGAPHFEPGFVRRVRNIRGTGSAAKLHLALSRLPAAEGLGPDDLGQRLVIADDENYVERAFNPAKYRQYSTQPVVEFTVPSIADASLAPAGKHVLSAVVQYAPADLDGGWTDGARNHFEGAVLDVLETRLPGLRGAIEASELLVAPDFEARFGLSAGHWHHAELALDQFMFVRPVPGATRYALPLDGLFLCGAGAHPGGGVSGLPGMNAAGVILQRDKSRWQ